MFLVPDSPAAPLVKTLQDAACQCALTHKARCGTILSAKDGTQAAMYKAQAMAFPRRRLQPVAG